VDDENNNNKLIYKAP